MSLFLTADLHFGHANIISYCDRPYRSVADMNADLVVRWNEVVTADDDVIVVGDLAMGRFDESLEYVSQLNGLTKMLCPGNHDRMFGTGDAKYRQEVDRYLSAGFDEVFENEIELELPGGLQPIVCHFPYLDDRADNGFEKRFTEARPADTGGLLIHGHQHGTWRRSGRMIDVGVDAWGGYPVSADVVATTFASNETELSPVPWQPRHEARRIAVGDE